MTTTLTVPANEILAGDITTDPMWGDKVRVIKVTINPKSVNLLVAKLEDGSEYGFARRLTTKTKVTR